MIRAACSTSRAFRSGIFVSAIWRTCARVSRPTFSRFGSPEPLSIRSASLMRTAAGGVFVMKVNERSSKTVISTGVIRPFWSAVWALNALQNSMMFTPCWPSAGPTGGAGVAAPAGTWSLISVRTLRAIWLDLLHLVEADFDRSLAAKDRHKHAKLARVVHHLGDLTRAVGERAGHDLDRFADRELCPRARPLGGLALEQTVDLGLRERHRLVLRAHESRHARRALDDGPRVLVQVHVDEYVARHRALLRLHA